MKEHPTNCAHSALCCTIIHDDVKFRAITYTSGSSGPDSPQPPPWRMRANLSRRGQDGKDDEIFRNETDPSTAPQAISNCSGNYLASSALVFQYAKAPPVSPHSWPRPPSLQQRFTHLLNLPKPRRFFFSMGRGRFWSVVGSGEQARGADTARRSQQFETATPHGVSVEAADHVLLLKTAGAVLQRCAVIYHHYRTDLLFLHSKNVLDLLICVLLPQAVQYSRRVRSSPVRLLCLNTRDAVIKRPRIERPRGLHSSFQYVKRTGRRCRAKATAINSR